jgi:hypothetical protein
MSRQYMHRELTMPQSPLAAEWSILQTQYDSYEKFSLLIKLFAVAVLAAAVLADHSSPMPLALLLVLWLQDAIWKTYQGRIETRLLELEAHLANCEAPSARDHQAFQYNRQFADNRPGMAGLLKEYLRQALRPTVAYPHLVLACLAIALVQA